MSSVPVSPVELGFPPRPTPVVEARAPIPDFVFEAVNALLSQHRGQPGSIILELREVEEAVRKKAPAGTKIESAWLNFEQDYIRSGWSVDYRRPFQYADECFEPYYTFRSK
jgi:hypothetical protein